MFIQAAPARRCLGISLRPTSAAKPSSLPPRCTASCATNPTAAASPAKPSFTNWTRAFAVCRPTTSIFTRFTAGITNTPIEETLEALHDVVKSGKVRYIGASSMHAWQFTKSLYLADLHGWTRFVSMQNHYNLLYREEEREMMPLCQSEGIGVIPWSPLARGRLARPWQGETTKRFETDGLARACIRRPKKRTVELSTASVRSADQRGVARAQLALAWMLGKPVTSPIVGATKSHHLKDAVAALSLRLTPEEVKSLDEPYTPHPVWASVESRSKFAGGRRGRGNRRTSSRYSPLQAGKLATSVARSASESSIAKTPEERKKNDDPRRSIAERYPQPRGISQALPRRGE